MPQVSRVFAANLVQKATIDSGKRWDFDSMGEVYMVTTDADLWPISNSTYDLPTAVDVVSLNALCCGSFRRHSAKYRMIPMSNIGARISTWQSLTNRLFCIVHIPFTLTTVIRMKKALLLSSTSPFSQCADK